MKWPWAIILTLGILLAAIVVSGLIGFDVMWIIIPVSAIWVAVDSSKINLKKYQSGISYGPGGIFFAVAVLWIVGFPWYLHVRYKIKSGLAELKETESNLGVMSTKNFWLLTAGIFVVLLGMNSVYTVTEHEQVLLTEFARVVEVDIKPGMHFKLPFVHAVQRFDRGVMTLDIVAERFLALDQNTVIVGSFVEFRVVDALKYYEALKYYKTTGGEPGFLTQLINVSLRTQINMRSMHDVVAGEHGLRMPELIKQVNRQAIEDFGVEVLDIRVSIQRAAASDIGSQEHGPG